MTKDVVIQISGGAHIREDAPQVIPNRLEANFKSNKCESMDGDASSALEMKLAALTSQRLKLTSQSCFQALTRISSRISSWREWREILEVKKVLCSWGVNNKRGLKGYL